MITTIRQKEITIELNPNKSASENAQQLFKQYQKLKKSKEVVTKEIEKAKAEIDYLDRLIQQLEDAREEDLEDIRAELEDEGYLKKKSTKNKKEKEKKSSVLIVFKQQMVRRSMLGETINKTNT